MLGSDTLVVPFMQRDRAKKVTDAESSTAWASQTQCFCKA